MSGGGVLVAGIGNIFLGDDGFGVEVVRRLAGHPLPEGAEVTDTGVRGVHLAYRLLDGYRCVVLVDAVPGDEPPGTLRLIEVPPRPAGDPGEPPVVDGHRMTPDAVLALLDTLSAGTGAGSRPARVLVVGCRPACLDEGIGLSAPVAAAVDEAVGLVLRVVGEECARAGSPPTATGPAARPR
ncbi:hydrogenase maturation protease [Streptomyces sp. NPDC046977]|uniref:hydrogenase maturation protease n=1 Tax=Streptomyces sp. NPDC046977 TaxID=3154703 RepID=UPI0033E14C75